MRWDDFDDSSGEKETDGIILINRNHVIYHLLRP